MAFLQSFVSQQLPIVFIFKTSGYNVNPTDCVSGQTDLWLKEISNNCTNICFPPVTAINSSIPKCKIEEESNCAKNIILRRKYDNNFLKKCETSCKTTQYTVTNQYFWNYNTTGNEPDQESKNWFWLWYMLSNDLGCNSQWIPEYLNKIWMKKDLRKLFIDRWRCNRYNSEIVLVTSIYD